MRTTLLDAQAVRWSAALSTCCAVFFLLALRDGDGGSSRTSITPTDTTPIATPPTQMEEPPKYLKTGAAKGAEEVGEKKRYQPRYDWTGLSLASPLAKRYAALQSDCSLPLAVVPRHRSSNNNNNKNKNNGADPSLASELQSWGDALCQTLESNTRVATHQQEVKTACGADSTSMTCYFPRSELLCPEDRLRSPEGETEPRQLPLGLDHPLDSPVLSSSSFGCENLIQTYGHFEVHAAATEFLFTRVAPAVMGEVKRQLQQVFPDGVPPDLITVHVDNVRSGDDDDDEAKTDIRKYVEAVQEILPGGDDETPAHIYLATEDPRALMEFDEAAPSNWIVYFDQDLVDDAGQKERSRLATLASTLVAMEANDFVLTTKSNDLSRTMDELRRNVLDPRCHQCTRMIDLSFDDDDRHLPSTMNQALQWRGFDVWEDHTIEPTYAPEKRRDQDDSHAPEKVLPMNMDDSHAGNTTSPNKNDEASLAQNFKTVLLTFLLPGPRTRKLRDLADVTLDHDEMITLTTRHLLLELRYLTTRKDDIYMMQLAMTPVKSQQSPSDSSASSAIAISEAMDGTVYFSPSMVEREGVMETKEVQRMVEKAFDGEALERYERRLQMYAEDPTIRSVQSIHMGLPWDHSGASGDSDGQQIDLTVVWIAIVAGLGFSVFCCAIVFLCRRRLATGRRSDSTPNKSRDSAETTGHDDEDQHAVIELSRVQSYQMSELTSVYIENNTMADEQSYSFDPPTSQVVAHHTPQLGEDDQDSTSDTTDEHSDSNASPTSATTASAELRCEQVRLAAEAHLEVERLAIHLADSESRRAGERVAAEGLEGRRPDLDLSLSRLDETLQQNNRQQQQQLAVDRGNHKTKDKADALYCDSDDDSTLFTSPEANK